MKPQRRATDRFNPDNPTTPEVETWDPARVLVYAGIFMAMFLVMFVCAVVAMQIWITTGHEATTAAWAALTGIIGTVMGFVGGLYAHRFGGTKQNAVKDETIAKQAQTAATIAQTVATNSSNSNTESPGTVANMDVTADNVTVTPPAQGSQPQKGTDP